MWPGAVAGTFADARAEDEQVFEDGSGGIGNDEKIFGFAAEALANIDAAIFAEVSDAFAGGGIDRVEIMIGAKENAFVFGAVGP